MCGIAGLIDRSGDRTNEEILACADAMAEQVTHRGPDDRGAWADSRAGVALGHRRLAVIDVSPRGHQPMASHDGRIILAYNGEIYNFWELRKALESEHCVFLGHSDTEVLVEGISRWGLLETLRRANGMFALAAWDAQARRLYLARDRLGEKPLYFAKQGPRFGFASELKALRAYRRLNFEIDHAALGSYLRHGYVPSPYSIYSGVRKVIPGTVVAVDVGTSQVNIGEPTPYWTLREAALAGLETAFSDADEADQALEGALKDSIRLRLVSDVPVGAFLSGGLDSSTVVALMQEQRMEPIRTFTVGFSEATHDEAGFARRIAKHLGTQHSELVVSPEDARAVIPLLPRMYDEPFADSSQIPTFLIARFARESVTVALSGDGGDELFAGYDRYRRTRQLEHVRRVVPRGVQQTLSAAALRVSPDRWDTRRGVLRMLDIFSGGQGVTGHRFHRVAEILRSGSGRDVYEQLVGLWRPADLLRGFDEPVIGIRSPDAWLKEGDLTSAMQYMDTLSYLPDDILVKVDRATMAVGLEARVPLLDHRLVELAWRVPPTIRSSKRKGKLPLRRILGKRLPVELFERPKMGFGVPIGAWLRGPLRDWADDLLAERRLRAEGMIDHRPVETVWREHLSGTHNWEYRIWPILMFEAWLEETHS